MFSSRIVPSANLLLRRHFLPAKQCKATYVTPLQDTKDRKYTARRACLYIPGNDEKKLKKVEGLDVDCVILDCEDGVALNRKVKTYILSQQSIIYVCAFVNIIQRQLKFYVM